MKRPKPKHLRSRSFSSHTDGAEELKFLKEAEQHLEPSCVCVIVLL